MVHIASGRRVSYIASGSEAKEPSMRVEPERCSGQHLEVRFQAKTSTDETPLLYKCCGKTKLGQDAQLEGWQCKYLVFDSARHSSESLRRREGFHMWLSSVLFCQVCKQCFGAFPTGVSSIGVGIWHWEGGTDETIELHKYGTREHSFRFFSQYQVPSDGTPTRATSLRVWKTCTAQDICSPKPPLACACMRKANYILLKKKNERSEVDPVSSKAEASQYLTNLICNSMHIDRVRE